MFADWRDEADVRQGAGPEHQRDLVRDLAYERAARAEAEAKELRAQVAQLQANHDRQVRLKRTLHEHYERLRHRVDTADAYIEHLRAGNNRHGECRVKTGPGSYECGEMLAYEAARRA